ncbi:MAG: hypothetical protein KGM15_05190 [Pseudomonadota bacterium]|nr:hypothetical protein [Pseudomonadota bacterium]
MRVSIGIVLVSATIGLLGSATAAAGGMGDPSTHLREMNAICEMQRRGQGPLSPDMCLPEWPPGPVHEDRRRR